MDMNQLNLVEQQVPQTLENIDDMKCIFKFHLDQIFETILNRSEQTELKFSSLKELCNYLLVMRSSLDGILNNKYFTKRELFYQNSHIFQKQETINDAIKQFSFNIQIPRRDLHIISASKGLVCGALILRSTETEINLLELTAQGKGLNITEFMDQWAPFVYGRYILVVEKETVYFHLINEMNQDFLRNTVIITGKGYPCYSTKRFVKYLSEMNPHIPVYYFGDMDPHGYDILCQYAFGNKLTLHEQNNIPWIRWLNCYIQMVDIKKQMKITQRERLLLESILQNPGVPEEWKKYMNQEFKFEIEDYQCSQLSSMILSVLLQLKI